MAGHRLAPQGIHEGANVIDSNGVVHIVKWSHETHFTIGCLAKTFFANGIYYVVTDEKPNCMSCLAENE